MPDRFDWEIKSIGEESHNSMDQESNREMNGCGGKVTVAGAADGTRWTLHSDHQSRDLYSPRSPV
jgi:hypothetical protein